MVDRIGHRWSGRAVGQRLLVAASLLVLVGSTVAPLRLARAADSDPAWLALINEVRSANGLTPVVVDDTLTAGVVAHLRYLRLTPPSYRTGAFASVHTENPASPYYTPGGADAGQSSNLAFGGATSDVAAIKVWLAGPFHAIGMLRPGLTRVAFARDPQTNAAGLDVLRGLSWSTTSVGPVMFPGPGTTTDLAAFGGGEMPNPLETCGYTEAGLPLIVLLPAVPAAGLTAELVRPDGSTITGPGDELCVETAANYVSTDPLYGATGRAILEGDRAVFLIPRHGLSPGTYSVRLHQLGQGDVTWTFTEAPAAPKLTILGASCTGTRTVSISGWAENDWASVGGAARRLTATVGAIQLGTIDLHAAGGSYAIEGTLRSSVTLPAGTIRLVVHLADRTTGARITSARVDLSGCSAASTIWRTSAPASIGYGATTRFTGSLVRGSSGSPIAGQLVILESRSVGASSWHAGASARTAVTGSVAFQVSPRVNTEYRLRAVGGAVSSVRRVSVAAALTASVSTSHAAVGAVVTIVGRVAPAVEGGRVFLQAKTSSGWRSVTAASISGSGSYRLVVPTDQAGVYDLRVYRPADAGHVAGASTVRRVTVT